MTAPRILIIDDDPDFVEIIKTILETKQYDVRYAHSPAEGIARLEEELPHLVILDIMMGKGTSMPEQTGFDFPGDPIHPEFLPVTEYMEKPVEPQVLLNKVESLLPKNTESRPG
jgi:DNA-binding response OmpR family regulator